MFVVEEPPFNYRDPWAMPVGDRLRALCDGTTRVAYFYERPDTSTFRYRVYNMIQVLRSANKGYGAAYFGTDDAEHLDFVADNCDVLVICRARYSDRINRLVTRARARGVRVLFDVDDLIFDPDYVHLILRTLDQDLTHPHVWDHWFGMVARIGATQKLCDAAITTNTYLGGKITAFSGLPVSIVPNFINQEQRQFSDRIYDEKVRRGFARTSDVHVGYFSGTPTHNHDFAMAARGLAGVMRRDPRVRLLIVGFLDSASGLSEFHDRIAIYPLHDFMNLQRLMSLVEINIVPVQDNSFTNCKSELKYFEAAAVGTLTVASPIHTYASAIDHGVDGLLAGSVEWEDRIAEAIDTFLPEYPQRAQVARARALVRYGHEAQLGAIEEALFGQSANSAAAGRADAIRA